MTAVRGPWDGAPVAQPTPAFRRLRRQVTDAAAHTAAHAVCEVLADQAARGFALIQWSTLAAEIRRWQQLQETTQ